VRGDDEVGMLGVHYLLSTLHLSSSPPQRG